MTTKLTVEQVNRELEEMHRKDDVRREAIRRGINREPGQRDTKVRGLPAAAVERAVTRYLGWIDELELEYGVGPVPEEMMVAIAESFADRLTTDRLLTKLEVAYNVELDITNGHEIEDGLLGRAVDGAIEAMTPYARTGSHSFLREAAALG